MLLTLATNFKTRELAKYSTPVYQRTTTVTAEDD